MQPLLIIIVILQILFITYIAWRIRYHIANPWYLGLFFLYKIIFAIIPMFASVYVNVWLSDVTGISNLSFIIQEPLTVVGLIALLLASGYSLSDRIRLRQDVLGFTIVLVLFFVFVFIPKLSTDVIYSGLYGEYFQDNLAFWLTKVVVFIYSLMVHILVAKNLFYYIVSENEPRMVIRWMIGLVVLCLSLILSLATTVYIVSVGLVGLNMVGQTATVIGLISLPLMFFFDAMFFYIPQFVQQWFIKHIFPRRDMFIYERLNDIVLALSKYGQPYIALDDAVDYAVRIPFAKNSVLDLMNDAKQADSHGQKLYQLLEPCESMSSDGEQLFFLVQISRKITAYTL